MPSAARYAAEKAALAAQGTTPYQERVRRGVAAGKSREEAAGHGGRELERIRRNPDRYPDATLRRVALRRAADLFADEPHIDSRTGTEGKPIWDQASVRERIYATDRETLINMIRISKEEWKSLASVQEPGNPFFYGGGIRGAQVAA